MQTNHRTRRSQPKRRAYEPRGQAHSKRLVPRGELSRGSTRYRRCVHRLSPGQGSGDMRAMRCSCSVPTPRLPIGGLAAGSAPVLWADPTVIDTRGRAERRAAILGSLQPRRAAIRCARGRRGMCADRVREDGPAHLLAQPASCARRWTGKDRWPIRSVGRRALTRNLSACASARLRRSLRVLDLG